MSGPWAAAPAQERVRLAAELLDRRRTRQAREVLRAALAADPDDAELLLQAARADTLDDDNASARQTLARILAREPQHLGARLLMAWVLTELGDLADAEATVLALLHEHPRSAELYASYARIMLRALHLPKARRLAAEALRLDPDSATALTARALCDIVELPDAAGSAAVRRLLAEHPHEQRTLSIMLAALVHAGRHREALRVAQSLLLAHPGDAELVQTTSALKAACHWSMRPLWPLQRWGWSASIALWVGGIALIQLAKAVSPAAASWAVGLLLAYVAYSWLWPPLIRRWVRRA